MTATDTTWPCCNCAKPVQWSTTLDGWEHLEGGKGCGEPRRASAAPGRYPRCQASRRVGGGLAGCDRPADGHAEHSASAVDYRAGAGSLADTDRLDTPLHWTTP